MNKVDIYKYLLSLAIKDMQNQDFSDDTIYEITNEIVGQINREKLVERCSEKIKQGISAYNEASIPADSVKGAEVSE